MKKTTILITILAIITILLVFLAIKNQPGESKKKITSNSTQNQPEKTVVLYFSPSYIDISTSSALTSIDLMVDTTTGFTTGIQAELAYDPKEITNVTLTPTQDDNSLFGNNPFVLLNNVDNELGRISYAIAISPTDQAIQGKGKIATLTFQKSITSATNQTIIFFLDKSLATKANESKSILKETSPIIIVLKKPDTTITPNSTSSGEIAE